MIYANGERYNGEWKDDKRSGKGSMMYATNERYDGEWKEDKRIDDLNPTAVAILGPPQVCNSLKSQ